MASANNGYRTAAIGITTGIGVVLPLAAYAVTLPYEPLNSIVRDHALPVAAGMLLGTGTLAATGAVLEARAARREAAEAEAERFASIFAGASPAATHVGASRSAREARRVDGVPVISRAIDALDEAEAWAEIDAMFRDGSPISCDPEHSKDMYQIAIEELMRTERMRAEEDRCKEREEREEVSARTEAMESLYGPAAAAPEPVQPVESVAVPMADYRGHEDMWASALSILAEADDEGALAHPMVGETTFVSRERMAAVAEGGASTQTHSMVNKMIEEEVGHVSSGSMRAATHEFLRVIDGGTASMPPLQQAEA